MISAKMLPVNSSCVSEIGYDEEISCLYVKFRLSGYVYKYAGVPKNVYDELMTADSIGKYLNRNIVHSYESIRVID